MFAQRQTQMAVAFHHVPALRHGFQVGDGLRDFGSDRHVAGVRASAKRARGASRSALMAQRASRRSSFNAGRKASASARRTRHAAGAAARRHYAVAASRQLMQCVYRQSALGQDRVHDRKAERQDSGAGPCRGLWAFNGGAQAASSAAGRTCIGASFPRSIMFPLCSGCHFETELMGDRPLPGRIMECSCRRPFG